MSENQKRFPSLTERLKTRAPLYPTALQRLGDALWTETENPKEHAQCLERLPEVIEAELAGESIVQRFPAVKHHLDRCDDCAEEYAALLEMEWAEQQGLLKNADHLPDPDLSFLPPLKRSLQTVVLEWTRAILLQLAPQNLSELDAVAQSVFVQLKPRRAAEGRSAYSHVLSNDVRLTDSARTMLTACLASTQDIAAHVSSTQFETWRNQQKLERELALSARSTARALGLDHAAATRFAQAFAAQIVRDPSVLREFLHSQ